MEFRNRVLVAGIILVCFLIGMIALDFFAAAIFPMSDKASSQEILLDEIFTKAGFRYGPQSWRPGYNALGIFPGTEIEDTKKWYLMFLTLNASPVSGNPDVRRVGAVKVTYNFSELSGRAVFDVYGLTTGTMPTRTNRQTGFGTCGVVVTGNATQGTMMPAATPLNLQPDRHYTVAISNNQLSESEDLKVETRTLRFNQPGGLGALHITTDLAKIKGMIVETAEPDGFFYVASTGNDPGGEIVLLVSVDHPQPDGFTLRIRSEFVRTG